MRLLWTVPTAACLTCLLLFSGQALSCPNCQAGVASEAENAALADGSKAGGIGNPALGYNVSILFMMAMPFLIVAGFATACYRMCKKQQGALAPIAKPAERNHPPLVLTPVEASCEDKACPCG